MNAHAAITAIFLVATTPAISQGGPLDPPAGPPGPTMKTLDQVEPRIALVEGSPGVSIDSAGTVTISQPGSYYLTANVDINTGGNAIVITADGVTLNLMGYTVRYIGAGTAGDAIVVNGSNVAIQNGSIISTTTYNGSTFTLGGFDRGVHAPSTRNNISVSDLSIQGVRGRGVLLAGHSCIIDSCRVTIAGSDGLDSLFGIIKNSVVRTTGARGIEALLVINCRVDQVVWEGISASVVTNSSAISSGSSGIIASHSVSGSFGQSTSTLSGHHGINASAGTVSGSRGTAAGGHGINASQVESSRGFTTGTSGISSSGINASLVSNSYGTAFATTGGHGIFIDHAATNSHGISQATTAGRNGISSFLGTVTGSYGTASGGHGIIANVVGSSFGYSTGTANDGSNGIVATHVSDSFGWSSTGGGHGIFASSVHGSHGLALSGALHGIFATFVSNSFGRRTSTEADRYGISATQANSSRSENGTQITTQIDMP